MIKGNVVTLDSHDNVIMGDSETMLGVIGMRDIALIKSGNAVLVCPLSEEQRVKELLLQIREEEYR